MTDTTQTDKTKQEYTTRYGVDKYIKLQTNRPKGTSITNSLVFKQQEEDNLLSMIGFVFLVFLLGYLLGYISAILNLLRTIVQTIL